MVALAVVPDRDGETVIVAGNQAGRLLSWRLSSLRPEEWLDGINLARTTVLADRDPERDMSSIAWLRQPGGMGHAAIPSGAGDIQFVDLATRAKHRWRNAHDSPVVALCEAGGLLYTADRRGLVRCWAGMAGGNTAPCRRAAHQPARHRAAAARRGLHRCRDRGRPGGRPLRSTLTVLAGFGGVLVQREQGPDPVRTRHGQGPSMSRVPGSGPAAARSCLGSRQSAHLPPVGGGDPAHRIAGIMDCGQDLCQLTGLTGMPLPRPRSGSRPIGQRPDWVGLGEAAGPRREVSGRSRHGDGASWVLVVT